MLHVCNGLTLVRQRLYIYIQMFNLATSVKQCKSRMLQHLARARRTQIMLESDMSSNVYIEVSILNSVVTTTFSHRQEGFA